MSKLKRDQADLLALAERIGANARRALVEGAHHPGEWRFVPSPGVYRATTEWERHHAMAHDVRRISLDHLVSRGFVETTGHTHRGDPVSYRVTVKGRLFVRRTQLDVRVALEILENAE